MKPPMQPPAKRGAPPPPKGKKADAGGPVHGVAVIIAPVRAGQQLGGAPGLNGDGSFNKPPPKVNPKASGNPAADQKASIRKSLNAAYKQQTSKR